MYRGFGGKETRSVPLAAAASIAAWHLKRPIRCQLDRDEDMVYSGQRHPFLGRWRVGVNKDGKLQALHLDVICLISVSLIDIDLFEWRVECRFILCCFRTRDDTFG